MKVRPVEILAAGLAGAAATAELGPILCSLGLAGPFRLLLRPETRSVALSWLAFAIVLLVPAAACRPSPSVSPNRPDRVGVYLASKTLFTLRMASGDDAFEFGPPNWIPLAGDWTGNGEDTIGLFDPAASHFFLNTENAGGSAPIAFAFGPPDRGFLPIAGDWDGDGRDTVGLYDPFTSAFHLRNENTTGDDDVTFVFGTYKPGLLPIAGRWNGGSRDRVGLYDAATSTFSLRVSDDPDASPLAFQFGPRGGFPIAGDWNGGGRDTVGVYDRPDGRFLLRNTNSDGPADIVIELGKLPAVPIKGRWKGR